MNLVYGTVALFASAATVAILARLTVRWPSILLFHLIWAVFSLLVRPVATVLYGTTLETERYFTPELYVGAWYTCALSSLCFAVGILSTYRPPAIRPKAELAEPGRATVILVHGGSIAAAVALLAIGGTAIMFSNRTTTMSIVSPTVRYIFPFVVVLCCAGTLMSVFALLRKTTLLNIAKVGLYYGITLLVAQRGFFIIFATLAAAMLFRVQQRLRWGALVTLAVLLLFGLLAKELMTWATTEREPEAPRSVLERIVDRPDGDAVEIWMLTLAYTRNFGFVKGASLPNNAYNIFSHTQRDQIQRHNGQDILNGYYNQDAYWSRGFGFNVTLPIELFLNFGWFGALLPLLPGALFGYALGRFDRAVFVDQRSPVAAALVLYGVWSLVQSFAGLQWAVLFIAHGMLFFIVEKLWPRRARPGVPGPKTKA